MCLSGWCPETHVNNTIDETGLSSSPARKVRPYASKLAILLLVTIAVTTQATVNHDAVVHRQVFGTTGKIVKIATNYRSRRYYLCMIYETFPCFSTNQTEIKGTLGALTMRLVGDSQNQEENCNSNCHKHFKVMYGNTGKLNIYTHNPTGAYETHRLFVERFKKTSTRKKRRRSAKRRDKFYTRWDIRSMLAGSVFDNNLGPTQHSDFEFEYTSCVKVTENLTVDLLPTFRIRLGNNATYLVYTYGDLLEGQTRPLTLHTLKFGGRLTKSSDEQTKKCQIGENIRYLNKTLAGNKKFQKSLTRLYKRRALRFEFESTNYTEPD